METLSTTMATGINQNIEILGRVLHIQTELSRGEDPRIRTTVFDSGRIVATREIELDPIHRAEDEILEQIRAQHALIIDNLITRSSALAERKCYVAVPFSLPPQDDASATSRAPRPGAGHPLPAGSDPSLRRSLRTRRLVGPFSLRFARDSDRPVDPKVELEAAGRSIETVMGSPAFRGLRLDEQIRFFDLEERIGRWRTGGSSDSCPTALLDDVTAFARNLSAVNDRRELVDFDHRLLLWALDAVGSAGVTGEILSHLESLRGRDANLDRLLDDRDVDDTDRLLEVLIELLDRTLTDG